jgi:serine/threonine protein phosphatase PrpC
MGSRMMNSHEESELERLRAERSAGHNGRRGAFYAPPPPAFRPKLGANPADVVNDPPLSASGHVLPLNMNPAAKSSKDTKSARRVSIGFAETTGKRPTMEDAWTSYSQGKDSGCLDLFGVFDGHRGDSAAKFAAEHLPSSVTSVMRVSKNPADWLRLGFIQTNLAMKQAGIATGTTAVVGMYWRNVVYLANAGDSRCVHGQVSATGTVATRMTEDHKPERIDETERIVALGGEVQTSVNKEGKVVGRVNGQLGVSRALGDFDLEPYIIPDPEITQIDLLRPVPIAEAINEADENSATSSNVASSSSVPHASSSGAAASSSNSTSPTNHTAINTTVPGRSPSGNVLHAVSSHSSPTNTTISTSPSHTPSHTPSQTSSAPPTSPISGGGHSTITLHRSVSSSSSPSTPVSGSPSASPIKSKPRPSSTSSKRNKDTITDSSLSPETTATTNPANFDFLVMACDGLWDVVTDAEAVDIASHVLKNAKNPEEAAKRLRNVAYGRGSTDNITVLIIILQSPVTGLKKSTSCIIL